MNSETFFAEATRLNATKRLRDGAYISLNDTIRWVAFGSPEDTSHEEYIYVLEQYATGFIKPAKKEKLCEENSIIRQLFQAYESLLSALRNEALTAYYPEFPESVPDKKIPLAFWVAGILHPYSSMGEAHLNNPLVWGESPSRKKEYDKYRYEEVFFKRKKVEQWLEKDSQGKPKAQSAKKPTKKSAGRPAGSSRQAETDKPHIDKMHILVASQGYTPHGAAVAVAPDVGDRTTKPESTARRLIGRYNKLYPESEKIVEK